MADPSLVPVPEWLPFYEIGIITGLIASLIFLHRIDRTSDWQHQLRTRLILGIPWGTLVSVIGVLGVYLFVQGGLDHWHRPLVIPFRSWSYFYPLGMLTAAFAHQGVGHLTGNLIGTVALGTLAEYAWGHFPTARGSASFSSIRTNPYARAFLGMPLAVIIAGLITSFFGWGPLIGFSGVVFAFAGFALVRYPLMTVVALTAEDAIRLIWNTLQDPVLTREAGSQFITPWWSGIAVQGHFLGLFLGIVGAAIVFNRRQVNPSRLWAGTFLVSTSLTLWAIWWFRGGSKYVLHRGIGVLFVLAIALLVTGAVWGRFSHASLLDVPVRQIALLGLIVPILIVGSVAVPLNATTVGEASLPDQTTIEVQDYSITYAENVINRQVSVINISGLGETTQVQTSGLIVISQDRHVWTTDVSKSRLAFQGLAKAHIGGLGWRETISVRRQGWTLVGNATVYRVIIRPPDGPWRLAYLAPPSQAEPVIENHSVSINVSADGFHLIATHRNHTFHAPIPEPGNSTRLGDIMIDRVQDRLYATTNSTRVRIAAKESYN